MNTIIKRPDSERLRNAIFRLESWMEQQPQAEIEIVHRFAPGVYSREMIVPAGVTLCGAVHKTEHVSIFLEGRMLIPDQDGESIEIEAPLVEIAKPGVKRVGLAIERVRWITVHPTEETDIAKLEQQLVTNDPVEADRIAHQSAMIGTEVEK